MPYSSPSPAQADSWQTARSPLDALAHGVVPSSPSSAAGPSRPRAPQAAPPPEQAQLYSRALGISRATSLRSGTRPAARVPSEELAASSSAGEGGGEGAEEAEERRRAEVRRQRAARLSSQGHGAASALPQLSQEQGQSQQQSQQEPRSQSHARTATLDDGPGPSRFASSTVSSGSGNGNGGGSSAATSPRQQQHDRDSTQLLGSSAFRSSVASDLSFNSLTGAPERDSILGGNGAGVAPWGDGGSDDEVAAAVRGLSSQLQRRESVSTVRSSEFASDGRWGRAWASEADDESLYGRDDEEEEEGEGAHATLAGLRGLAIGQGFDELPAVANATRPAYGRAASSPQFKDAAALHHVGEATQAHVVSLTRSPIAPQAAPQTRSRRDTIRSVMADIEGGDAGAAEDDDAELDEALRLAQAGNRDSVASIASVSTIRNGGSAGSDGGSGRSVDNAHVYVWPPTPAGSTSSHSGSSEGRASLLGAEMRGTSHPRQKPHDVQAMSARIETVQPHPPPPQAQQPPPLRAPVGPSAMLARPLGSPILTPDGARRSSGGRIGVRAGGAGVHGHPGGRAPPPPPDAGSSASGGYSDPNASVGPSQPALGRARAQAVRDADGRESIVSDLDVETLRLDGSSRRASSSTLGSNARMSVGTVHYDTETQAVFAARRRESLESMYSNRSAEYRAAVGGSTNSAATSPAMRSPQAPAGWELGARGVRGMEPPRRADTQPNAQSEQWHPDELQRSNTSPQRGGAWPQATSSVSPRIAQTPRQGPSAAAPPLRTAASYSSVGGSSLAPSVRTLGSSVSDTVAPARSGPLRADTRTGPSAAEELLSQGITHHENGELARSAYYFERSARVEGGCVVGMCMWGMALREGWGARKDPKRGFEWISRAAARAGEMMGSEGGRKKSENELRAIRSELKLSVYELGKCFCYGWGIKMDKRMALEYFELAAKLGDADAQAEAAALLAAGKGGCKKDLKRAAQYYRMAEAQGYDTVGLSWIHKDKYS